jgi:class 3 adenylate cyclase
MVARYPLREGLRRQHMLALYRSGRQAEALAAYQDARRVLADELGIEPSPALRELERKILQQDASLDLAPAPAHPPPTPVPVPEPVPERPVTASACPSCGTESPAGTSFCPGCGAALAEAAPEEMLKLVTILFADVVGSTVLTQARHPEDVRALMADYFAAMAGEIRAEGGTIEKFIGDAIMAVFGVPAVREDDAVRAVRAALRMRERLRRWNEARDPAQGLEIRIGLSTGEVLASGSAGADLRVTGDAVNLAARLQQATEPGTISISDRTARVVSPHFRLRPLGEPEAAWLVEGGHEGRQPPDAPAVAAPLVGREHELAFLQTTFQRSCRESRPALVTVVGDAGVGKSRLVREFLSSLEGRAKVLVGRCLPSLQGITLEPLAEMLKAEAGVLDTDPAEEALAKIAGLVEATVDPSLVADRTGTAPGLAATLGAREPEGPFASLDPRELYRRLVDAWRALLASLGKDAPVVAVVEDLHWADPTMLDVLDELAERIEGPILFVCTARPDLLGARPGWGGGRRSFSSLPLDPLSAEESARLVAALPGVEGLPDGIRRLILERSAGNPFFLEEIIRHLIGDGTLVWEGERWRARAGVDRIDIPDTVQAVILARLDLLAPDERRVAQRAAVVGRVFWDDALARLVDVEGLDDVLETLRRLEFVRERLSSSLLGRREYLFKHVLIRDVAYASLPRAERGRAHVETAAWIEETSGGRRGESAEQLANHYDAAFSLLRDDDLRCKARAHLLAGATNAYRRFAVQQGEQLARRAVELSRGRDERVEALESLGDLYYLAFLGDAAWRTYGEALAELQDGDLRSARLAGKATLFAARYIGSMHELPDVETVRAVIEPGLRAAPAPGPERAILLVNRGFLLAQRIDPFDEEAEAAVREAAAAAEALGDPDILSAALDLVQMHEELSGRRGDSHRTSLRRVELVPRLSDVKEIGDSYAGAARSALHAGRYREAETFASACVERSHGIDSGSYLHGLAWRVGARFALGDWDAALADQAELERVVGLAARELPPGYAMGAYTRSGLCHELRGEREQADRYVELGLRYVAARGVERVRGPSIHLPPLALTLARRRRFDEAMALVPLVPRSAGAGVVLEALCELVAALERWDDAAGLVEAAREEAEAGDLLTLPPVVDRLEGRAAAAQGDAAEAAALLGRSAAGFAELEARWEEAFSRLLLAEALAGGDRPGAERQLRTALPVFEQLGSVVEAERARAALERLAVANR